MKNYQEQTDMERLLTKLSQAMLDDEGENDIHRMFHNAKGSNDAVEAVHELIMNLIAYKEAAMKDMRQREYNARAKKAACDAQREGIKKSMNLANQLEKGRINDL